MTNSFDIGVRFKHEGQWHEVVSIHENDELVIETPETGERHRITQEALVGAYYRGDLVFDENSLAHELPAGETHWGDIAEGQRAAAEHRYEIIGPFLNLKGKERSQAIFDWCEASSGRNPSGDRKDRQSFGKSTIYRWLKLYEESGHDIRSLVPKVERRRKKTSIFGDEVESTIERSIKANSGFKDKPGIERVYLDVISRITRRNTRLPEDKRLRVPSRRTVARRIALHDPKGKVRQIRGRTPNRIQQASYTRELLPLEVAEIDHTTLDLFVIDEETGHSLGRPTFTLCIDVATRLPLGFYIGFMKPSYGAVLECMFHSLLPKTDVCEKYGTENQWLAYGVPSTLIVDNGREFVGKDLRSACQQLGINLEASPVATPQHKSHVERTYRTINDGLIHQLRGTTGSNPQDRGDYDSEGEATYTLSTLYEAITIYLVDLYSQTIHRSLEMTPAARWESFVAQGMRRELAPAPDKLAIILSRAVIRVIQPYGVEWHGEQYWSPDLSRLRSRLLRTQTSAQVTVRMHEGNMGKVYVYDEKAEDYIAVPSRDPRLEGISVSYHERLREVQKQQRYGKQNDAQRARAQARLRWLDEQARKSKSLRQRGKAAREEERKTTSSLLALQESGPDEIEQEQTPAKPEKLRGGYLSKVDRESARDQYVPKKPGLDRERLNEQTGTDQS